MNNKSDDTSKIRKRLLISAVIIADIIAVGLIPLNMFYLKMPECVSIIAGAVIVIMNVLLWSRAGKGKAAKLVVTLFSVVTGLFCLFASYCNPYWNSNSYRVYRDSNTAYEDTLLSRREALKDLDYAMKYLKKLHPALYHGMPEELETQYERAAEYINSCDQIDVRTLTREIEQIFSLLHDGHTYVNALYDDRHYLKYIYEHNQAGDRVVGINGMTLDELFDKNSHLISYDTREWGMTFIKQYISTAEGLDYLGISLDNGVKYTYEDVNGDEHSFVFYRDDFLTYPEYEKYNGIEDDTDEAVSFVSYLIDEENDVAVLTLDSCNYNDEYRRLLEEMFAEIKARDIHNVAVDLRNNGGGSSLVANEFIRYLDVDSYKDWSLEWRLGVFNIPYDAKTLKNDKHEELLFDGQLYLLTSVYTYSSAMDFAMLVKDNHLGTIIGEAPGNHPSSCGNIASFTLPNSGAYMQISTKRFYRVDQSLGDLLIEPDIPCDVDDAMEHLYSVIEDMPEIRRDINE